MEIRPYAVRYKAGSDKTILPGLHGRFETMQQAQAAMERCALFFGDGVRKDGFIVGRAVIGIVVDNAALAQQKVEESQPDPLAGASVPELDMTEMQKVLAENARLPAIYGLLQCVQAGGLMGYGVDLVVIEQPDGSLAQLPTWMLREAAALLGLRADPRFPLEVLRSLRFEVDALLGSLPSESDLEKDGDDADFRKSTAEPVRTHRGNAAHCTDSNAESRTDDAGGSPARRDRRDAGKGGRQ